MCKPSAVSPAVAPPDAVAVLRNVITSLRFVEEPIPLAEAVLGAVCRPIAVSPLVAPPVAVAERILL